MNKDSDLFSMKHVALDAAKGIIKLNTVIDWKQCRMELELPFAFHTRHNSRLAL